MKIYKVENTARRPVWFGNSDVYYTCFICVANSEDEARRLHPDDFQLKVKEDGSFSDGCYGWALNINDVKVTEIGEAAENYTAVEVLCTEGREW